MQLGIFREIGTERVQLVGLVAGGLRPRYIEGEDGEEVEVPLERRAVAPTDIAAALDREEVATVALEEPGELIRIEGFAEGVVAGGGGYVAQYMVSMLPYGHYVVHLDRVTGHALVPLEPLDGTELDPIVASYQAARQRQAQGTAGKERKRVRLT